MAETELVAIRRASAPGGDVVFVHGLGGDARDTWRFSSSNSWGQWIAQNRPDLNIWSLKYDVQPTEWQGHAMPLSDRALNVLALFDNKGLGSRPIVYVVHSMGGLLVKELIRHADTTTPKFQRIAQQTKAIAFFATPHTGSSVAVLAEYLRLVVHPTVATSELVAHGPRLRDLNLWFRNNYRRLGIRPCIFFETKDTYGVRVVNETSADGGYEQYSPIPIDATHVSITKPEDYDSIAVGQTLKLIDEAIPSASYIFNPDLRFAPDLLPKVPAQQDSARYFPRFNLARFEQLPTFVKLIGVAIAAFAVVWPLANKYYNKPSDTIVEQKTEEKPEPKQAAGEKQTSEQKQAPIACFNGLGTVRRHATGA